MIANLTPDQTNNKHCNKRITNIVSSVTLPLLHPIPQLNKTYNIQAVNCAKMKKKNFISFI